MSLTIGYSTRIHNPVFIEYLKKSSGFKKIEVIEKVNNGEKSLSQVYNEILKESSNDIVVLCHDDIYFDTSSWYHKLIKHFEKTDFGILGMAGTTYMPESGRWWENRKKMFGIVNHEHEGKKWESKYSSGLGNDIKQCVVVDGLFIAIDKRKIKKQFDETVEGFHFYDIEFCFQNFLEGVKIGVISNIRITHKSIGMTNEQWENNRDIFSNKYKSYLPKFLPREKNEKIRVILSVLSNTTELNSFKSLVEKFNGYNWELTVLTDNEKKLSSHFTKYKINYYEFSNPVGYKLGDGKWLINNSDGPRVSQPNVLYKINQVNHDILIVFSLETLVQTCKLYPQIPKISISDREEKMTHTSVKKSASHTSIDDNFVFNVLNSEHESSRKQKIKILTGYSERGGSTSAQINLTNILNENGYDCVFYGPHDFHIDKCKSGFSNELTFNDDDILLCHVVNFQERPKVKKVIYCSHEKWWYDFSKTFWYWDEAVFLHEKHREFHSNYTGNFEIIPNFKENLLPINKPELELIAGVVGSIEDRKQTHLSIERAINDGCEKIFLFGQIGDNDYYENFVKPKVDNKKVFLIGHINDKQSMYNSIGRVYHSSKGEVACLVKDECYLTNTKFFGNEETDNEVSDLTNKQILELWKKIFEK